MIIVWRLSLIVVAALLAWQVLVLGLADYYANPQRTAESRDLDAALAWNAGQQDALAGLAARIADGDPEGARVNLVRLIAEAPTNTAALIAMSRITDDSAQADALVETAVRLAPANPERLKDAAAHWLKAGDLTKATDAYSRAMIADPGQIKLIAPLFLKLAEEPGAQAALAPFAESPPFWWDAFFGYAARTATDVDTLRALYAMRTASAATPLSARERRDYVERLRKDRQFTEAYLVWVSGLRDEQRHSLGLLNNGGFETEPSNWGFDWRLSPSPNLVIETIGGYGAEGKQSLHIAFRGFDARFNHLSQDLFLEPGSYRLTGRARLASLRSSGGLQWQVQCDSAQGTTKIAEGERIAGTHQWEPFQLNFQIPPECERPVLRLVGVVRSVLDQRIDGSIWLDSMRIQRLGDVAAGTVSRP